MLVQQIISIYSGHKLIVIDMQGQIQIDTFNLIVVVCVFYFIYRVGY